MDNQNLDTTPMKIGDLVQINPHNEAYAMFAGCILVVTEVRSWGVQGYVQALGQDGKPGGQAYLRPKWEDIEYCGQVTWMA